MNGSPSAQTQFKFQRPYERIYRVGPALLFTTIQAAINQAVADGFTSNANSALIEIYDKGSDYVEDLVLSPGVSLRGITGKGGNFIGVNGAHSFAPTSGTRQQNRLYAENIYFGGNGAASPTFSIGGTNGFEIFFSHCGFSRKNEDGQPALVVNNSAGQSNCRLRLYNCQMYYFDTANAGAEAVQLSNCRMVIEGEAGDFYGEGGFQAFFRLMGSMQFTIVNVSPNGPGTAFGFEGSRFVHASDNARVVLSNSSFGLYGGANQNLCYVDSDNVSLSIFGSLVESGDSSSKLVGSDGVVTNTDIQIAGNYYRNGTSYVDPNLTINPVVSSQPKAIFKNGVAYAFAGDGLFTIQEAIDYVKAQANSFGGGVVQLMDGFFNEDITLPGGVHLKGQANRGGQNTSLNGTITFQYDGSGDGTSSIENMNLGANEGSPAIVIDSDNAGGILEIKNCQLNKGGNGADPIITFNSGKVAQVMLFDCRVFRFSNDSQPVICHLPDSSGQEAYFYYTRFEGNADMLVADGTGRVSFGNCSFGSAENEGRNNIADTLEVIQQADGPRRGSFGDKIVVYARTPNGFFNVQDAIEAAYAASQAQGNRPAVVYVGPGNANENITLRPFVELVGLTDVEVNADRFGFPGPSGVYINGSITLDNTDTGGAGYTIRNINFNLTDGQIFTILGNQGGQLFFQNCLFNSNSNLSDALLEITSQPGDQLNIQFVNCNLNRSGAVNGPLIVASGANSNVRLNFTKCCMNANTPNAVMIYLPPNFTDFTECFIRGEARTVMQIDGSDVQIYFSEITVFAREIFFFNTDNQANPVQSYLDPNFGDDNLIARAGEPAQAAISLTSNVFPGGSGYDVNGTQFINGTDFAVGVDENETAQNLADAINSHGRNGTNDPNIAKKITARAVGAQVFLDAIPYGTVGNGFTLADVGTPPSTLAPFTGGVNGAGTIVYGSCAFGNNDSNPGLNYFEQANQIVSI